MEEPESLGTLARGVFAAGGITKMLDKLGEELALGVAENQLFVPVFKEEPAARLERASMEGVFGTGAIFGGETVGMRTMFVPPEMRPKEDEPRLTLEPLVMGEREMLEEPCGDEEPMEIPLDEVKPDELIRGGELLLPLELLLLPLELLLLPLELLCEALAPLEPRCASTGASRMKRSVVRTKESWRIWRIAVPFGAVRMRDGCLKQRGLRGDGTYRANRMPNSSLSGRDLRIRAEAIRPCKTGVYEINRREEQRGLRFAPNSL